MNRSKYSNQPEDVLWVDKEIEENKCEYFFNNECRVIKCVAKDLEIVNKSFPEIKIYCEYSYKNCNIAHSNIVSTPSLKDNFEKPKRRAIMLKLASLFCEVSEK